VTATTPGGDAGAPPRVLVTGGGGFIGRACLPLLTAAGYEVHAVTSRADPAPIDGVLWHRADLLDPAAVDALCDQVRADDLLHLAWVTTPGSYTHTAANLDWVAASLRLVRRFVDHGGRRIVGAGTCFEYAHVGAAPLHETMSPLLPDTLYGTSKVALASVITRFAQEAGVTSAWGRVFFLYGPHEHPNRLVSSVIRALLEGREAPCTVGTQVRDFLHVRDVAAAFVALLRSPTTGSVNIASGGGVTVRDLVLEIGEQIGRPELVILGARSLSAADPPYIVADATRLRDEIGFAPDHDLHSGLADTIAWWRGHLAAPEPTRSEKA
jgi:nucleoside-diphosphate-sugar epimerase